MEAKEILKYIEKDRFDKAKHKALEGVNYYKGKHDILNHRIFYFNSEGSLVEDRFRSNIKIPHMFHRELVDQKVQYLLGSPICVLSDDETLQERLDEYFDENMQKVLQDLVEGASNKGCEYLYGYIDTDNKLSFQVINSLSIIEIESEDGRLKKAIRYYDTKRENKLITKIEYWTEKDITYYELEGTKLRRDAEAKINPRPHIVSSDGVSFYDEGGLGYVPFFKLKNNKYEQTDLEPIKHLIDDYDLMAASLSNNLQDFQDVIYVVKDYEGDSLDELVTNLKTRKTVGVGDSGGLDIKTVDIPYEARKTKLELDKEAIYKFGMGFDSSQVGDGNITNIVIKSRYSLLDLKTNKIEINLRQLIQRILESIIQDINRRFGEQYTKQGLEINIERSMILNDKDQYENKRTEEQTRGEKIKNILTVSAILSEDTVLEEICRILELDYMEEKERIEHEEDDHSFLDLNKLSDDYLSKGDSDEEGV